MSVPVVSVIVPVYDRAQLLACAVESVHAQTWADWELIVADDGSTDATVAMLARLEASPRVRVLRLAHSGNPAAVRNAALRAARGEYLAFLDSDDVWMPDKLERQMALFRALPERRWSYTGFVHVDAAGSPLGDGVERRWSPREGWIFEATLTGRAPIRTASVVMAERALIESAGGFDEELVSGQDYDLWMRLALRSEASVLAEPLAAVRVHAASHSSRWPPRALEYREISLRKIAGAAGPEWRLPIDLQRRRNAAALAASYLAHGAHAQMWATLRRSFRSCWHDPRWCASSVRTLVRAALARTPTRGRALAP